jgi:hypothetical protein
MGAEADAHAHHNDSQRTTCDRDGAALSRTQACVRAPKRLQTQTRALACWKGQYLEAAKLNFAAYFRSIAIS